MRAPDHATKVAPPPSHYSLPSLVPVRHTGDAEKVVAILVSIGIPIAVAVDLILVLIYAGSAGSVGEPFQVTRGLLDLIGELSG